MGIAPACTLRGWSIRCALGVITTSRVIFFVLGCLALCSAMLHQSHVHERWHAGWVSPTYWTLLTPFQVRQGARIHPAGPSALAAAWKFSTLEPPLPLDAPGSPIHPVFPCTSCELCISRRTPFCRA